MVLVSSAIVMVVGVSALMAVRIEQSVAAGAGRAAEARVHARAAIEMALTEVNDDPTWRDSHTHDQWTDPRALAAGQVQYKLVNTTGGELADDPTSAVWLYGRAIHGQVERTARVLLQPTSQIPDANLLRNPRMHEGGRHWWTPDVEAELRHTDHDAQTGDGSLLLRNRPGANVAVSQDVTDRLESGISYELAAHVRMPDANDHMIFELYTRDTVDGVQRHNAESDKIAGNPWRHVLASVTPEWSGTLEEARWQIYTRDVDAEFFLDDATLVPTTHGQHMTAVPSTWQRVVD